MKAEQPKELMKESESMSLCCGAEGPLAHNPHALSFIAAPIQSNSITFHLISLPARHSGRAKRN